MSQTTTSQSRSYLEPAKLYPNVSGHTPKDLFECSSAFPPDQVDGLYGYLYHRVLPDEVSWDPDHILLYTDGSCPSNGHSDAAGGCGVVWHGPLRHDPNAGTFSFRLEDYGPTGERKTATNIRAELRAAIAALQLCDWPKTRIKKIIIATDSEYVVKGATIWCRNWIRNGLRKDKGGEVLNPDLWTVLLQLIANYQNRGMIIYFWHIPRDLNERADLPAKNGAKLPQQSQFKRHSVLEELWNKDKAGPPSVSNPTVYKVAAVVQANDNRKAEAGWEADHIGYRTTVVSQRSR